MGYEVYCEGTLTKCTIDMLSYKAYLTRWMAAATKVAPFIYDSVIAVLQTSAKAAALQCSGGSNGRMCGLSWYKEAVWDGTSGVGQQMAALEAIQSNLILHSQAPLTGSTGGSSQGQPNGGSLPADAGSLGGKATTGGKVGAGILTAIVAIVVIGGLAWVSMPDVNA